MRISNGALYNTHRAHAAQIKLIHIDLNKGEQRRTKLHWHFVGRVGK